MTSERKAILKDIASGNLDNIIESWWYEIGSWDGLLEDEVLTMEELEWIWDNIYISASIQTETDESEKWGR